MTTPQVEAKERGDHHVNADEDVSDDGTKAGGGSVVERRAVCHHVEHVVRGATQRLATRGGSGGVVGQRKILQEVQVEVVAGAQAAVDVRRVRGQGAVGNDGPAEPHSPRRTSVNRA